jgi:hypothetical protein
VFAPGRWAAAAVRAVLAPPGAASADRACPERREPGLAPAPGRTPAAARVLAAASDRARPAAAADRASPARSTAAAVVRWVVPVRQAAAVEPAGLALPVAAADRAGLGPRELDPARAAAQFASGVSGRVWPAVAAGPACPEQSVAAAVQTVVPALPAVASRAPVSWLLVSRQLAASRPRAAVRPAVDLARVVVAAPSVPRPAVLAFVAVVRRVAGPAPPAELVSVVAARRVAGPAPRAELACVAAVPRAAGLARRAAAVGSWRRAAAVSVGLWELAFRLRAGVALAPRSASRRPRPAESDRRQRECCRRAEGFAFWPYSSPLSA